MPCPASWVDSIFAALASTYGVAFQRQYADVKPEAVKSRWAHALDGLTASAIKGGLERLPADKPPNALQFRRLCVDSIPGEAYRVHTALPAPVVAPPPHVAARLARIRARATGYASRAEQDAALGRAEEQALQDEPGLHRAFAMSRASA